ncbi:DUF371 domain-containing protein [Candidatus Nitrosotenuis aquarius]|uniref:DUF371 domain-containing protein n=1 Tax=Candidatus Nitrosotenuis aquarius TaxID=1846278 RepID=UPI000C1DCDEB|nr:DUF371 domain-containing protein [Candidatus Nitrosotenuis aquarius]
MRFEIPFFGHENVRALHTRTIEITTEHDLTLQGDCIVGVGADHGCVSIPENLKEKLRRSESKIIITIQVDDEEFVIEGKGHEDLRLENPHDIVIRKSNFLCPRTLAIGCDKASDDIPRKMIKKLQNPKTKGLFVIEVT